MRIRAFVILCLILISDVNGFAGPAPGDIVKNDVVTISVQQQYDVVSPGGKSALAIHFELAKNWHFYASAKTAPGGMNLKLKASSADYIVFSEPIFPPAQIYFDKSSGKKLDVFSNKFTVFMPFTISRDAPKTDTQLQIKIAGAVCSQMQCRMPDFGQLGAAIKIAELPMGDAKFTLPQVTLAGDSASANQWANYSIWFALGLAFLAGLSLNIMPCIWPVLPVIIMRIVEQAKQSKGKSTAMGLVFCLGILLFFASLAGANIILHLLYGTVLQWGDQFRNPAFVAGMALLLIVLALFMFGLFTITIPSAVAGKSGSGKGYGGAVGMGFLAAVLSTPCSFAILAAAFAWAQAQRLPLGTLAIMIMGIGMAAPYLILTSMPGLLKRLPRAGQWMEVFKQAVGFILLGIAVWLIAALPSARRIGVLYFAVVLSFAVWMWGRLVSYNTKFFRKWLVRSIAVVLAVFAGLFFLVPTEETIKWQPYDSVLIETSLKDSKPVLIEFTADWCLSCKVVEKTVYAKKDIAKLIKEKNVLAIKADTTRRDQPATSALKNIYNEPGVPVSMLFMPGEKEPTRWRGKAFGDELKTLLEKFPSRE